MPLSIWNDCLFPFNKFLIWVLYMITCLHFPQIPLHVFSVFFCHCKSVKQCKGRSVRTTKSLFRLNWGDHFDFQWSSLRHLTNFLFDRFDFMTIYLNWLFALCILVCDPALARHFCARWLLRERKWRPRDPNQCCHASYMDLRKGRFLMFVIFLQYFRQRLLNTVKSFISIICGSSKVAFWSKRCQWLSFQNQWSL